MLGNKIKYRREKLDMNKMELADKSRCTYYTIRSVENGSHDIRISRLLQIADALNVSIDWLLDRSKTMECNGKSDNKHLERLKFAIKQKKFTINFIAKKSGLDKTTVEGFKYGQTDMLTHNIEAMCDVLGISVDWLFGRKEQMEI